MAKGVHGEALQHVRMLFEAGAVGGLTDKQLLERFRTRDGEAAEWAFAALVERHGPMIFRVCRRILRDEHAAQDAFQATFLVLVRKAGSLRAEGSLGGWLHSVACRVAASARGAEARRRAHERRAALTVDALTVDANGGGDDLGPALHEEIGRLPEAYRTAVVLCDLEGLTQDQAAQRLGCPSGTVRSRLARGRGRLRARLIRRGLTPSGGAMAALLASEEATAAVPAVLMEATVRVATCTATGQMIAGAGSATALSAAVLRALFMIKLKWISTAVLVLGLGASGTAVIALQQAGGPPAPAPAGHGSGDPASPKAADVEPQPKAPAQDPPDVVVAEGEIALAKANLKRAEDRVVWSDRMYEKGYVSMAQNIADKEAVKRARFALEQALAKRKRVPQESLPGTKTPEERERVDEDREAVLRSSLVQARADLNHPWPRFFFNDAELAGLAPDGRPGIINWEQAYALALIRSRAGRRAQEPVLAEALDPKGVAEQVEKYGITDFARFRNEFLAGPGDAGAGAGTFRDPTAEVLDLLRRRQEVENACWNIVVLESLLKVVRDLLTKESATGLSQLELDQVDDSLQEARLRMVDQRERYRDQLDVLKVHLGLAPHVPIALDPESLAGFRDAFEEVNRRRADPQRDSTDLPRIAAHLPVLEDIVIDGISLVAGRDDRPALLEERLSAAVRLALKNQDRGDRAVAGPGASGDAERALRVRHVIRRLMRIRIDYALEQRRFVLVARRQDQAQERLLAPPGIASPRRERSPKEGAELVAELIGTQGQLLANRNNFVSLWTEYQTARLALYRDLGTLPSADWKSFYDQLTARRSGDHP